MKPLRFILVAVAALGLQACSTVDTATRASTMDSPILSTRSLSFAVKDVRVSVPESLSVSEANLFYPQGDIVWRGEARGDRHAQVAAMFDAGMKRGVASMKNTGQPVIVDIQVARFHALSEKARYSFGGVHNIKFVMTVRDATTGAIILPAREINSDLKGLGGNAAIEAEARGFTEKVQITEHLARVIQLELTRPGTAEQKKTIFSDNSDVAVVNAL
ncbi:DUF6778 family protein [Pseudogemmobacter sp. W21_MBD1_M6]|uniref:DUF6778 family protein n=1 Tax=Pseudogemmobacter sp. W21_MBD1_M6 TaxID=3240271 RepID=UPI003F993AF3